MKSQAVSLAIVAGLAAAALLVIRPWEGRPTKVPGKSSTSPADACISAPNAVPPFTPALSSHDCITSTALLPSGDVAIGTKQGFFGVVQNGTVALARPPGASGVITDIAFRQSGANNEWPPVVMFVVDQGVGVYIVRTQQFLTLTPGVFDIRGNNPPSSRFVTAANYVGMPGPGRPTFSPQTQSYTKMTADNTEQLFGFDISVDGKLCGIYTPRPGALSGRLWCTASGVIFPAPVITPAP